MRDASGTSFRTGDGVLALVEVHTPQAGAGHGTYKLGAWFNSERFADQRLDTAGLSLADPLSTGTARLLGSNYGLYGIIDQPLFRTEDGKTGPEMFARAMGAPGDRNLVDFYVDAGLAYTGPFDRDDDIVGIGFGYARIGNSARALDRDTAKLAGCYPGEIGGDGRGSKPGCQIAVTPWWRRTAARFQYIFDPGGSIPSPAAPGSGSAARRSLGLRSVIVSGKPDPQLTGARRDC